MKRGFMLVDALVGLALLALLVSGLHELRSVQIRSVRSARARLAATETAAAAALLRAEVRPGVTLATEPLPALAGAPALVRVTARAEWRAGAAHGVEEVSSVAAAH
jgi:type II secretory pathway component PulK